MAELTDLADADRVARGLARLRAKRARVKAEYEAAAEKALSRIDRQAKYSEERLERYLARQLEADEDGDPLEPKTYTLPCRVELKYRPNPIGQRRLVIKDEAALMEWAASTVGRAGRLLIPTETLDRAELRLMLEEGIEVDGAYLADPEWALYGVTIPKSLMSDEAEDDEAGA